MSYRVEQRIGNNDYVYDVTSVWDKIKKQPRQIRKYIGKKDPISGEIIPPKRSSTPKAARDFGNIYLMSFLANDIKLVERDKGISQRLGRAGWMILLNNDENLGFEEAIWLYRRKDMIEKMFDLLKNEADGKRLRVQSIEAARGKLLLEFVALILRCALMQRVKSAGLHKTLTLPQIFYEMKKLKAVEMLDGRKYLTELTRKQKEILSALKIPSPSFNT